MFSKEFKSFAVDKGFFTEKGMTALEKDFPKETFERLEADYIKGSVPSADASLKMIGGIPGAGKSYYADHLIAETEPADTVKVAHDEMIAYCSSHSRGDARKLEKFLIAKAMFSKRNVIMDNAMIDTDHFVEIAKASKKAGYTSEAVFLTASGKLCRQRACKRREQSTIRYAKLIDKYPALANVHPEKFIGKPYEKITDIDPSLEGIDPVEHYKNLPRIGPARFHKEGRTEPVNTMHTLEKEKLVDRTVLLNEGYIVYMNDMNDPEISIKGSYNNVRQAIADFQERPMKEPEKREFVAEWRKIYKMAQERNAPDSEMQEIRDYIRKDVSDLFVKVSPERREKASAKISEIKQQKQLEAVVKSSIIQKNRT